MVSGIGLSEAIVASKVKLTCNQAQSIAISRNQSQSVAICRNSKALTIESIKGFVEMRSPDCTSTGTVCSMYGRSRAAFSSPKDVWMAISCWAVAKGVKSQSGRNRVALICMQSGRNHMQSDAIRCSQMQSDAISCTQLQSEAVRGTQMHSDALRGTQWHLAARSCEEARRCELGVAQVGLAELS